MDHVHAPLSSPDNIERFRLVAQTALEVRGQMDADLKALLDRKAQEFGVHRLDAEQVMGELLDGYGGVVLLPQSPEPPRRRDGQTAGEETRGPDGGAYVWVPAGEFTMGSDDGDEDELPVDQVRISRGFWLSRFGVSNEQYRRFCDATGATFPEGSTEGQHHPVTCVSWEDASAYCRHYGLRLPTEAEWEYAARGADGLTYPWGSGWNATRCCNTHNRGPGGRTLPVGSLPSGASWCGALDMAGNVWEWCSDWYHGQYVGASPRDHPECVSEGAARVVRGGSWNSDSVFCRSSLRDRAAPAARGNGLGFRPVISQRVAELSCVDGRLTLRGLGGPTGAWVNGHRLPPATLGRPGEPVDLDIGDLVRLGDVELRIVPGAQTAGRGQGTAC